MEEQYEQEEQLSKSERREARLEERHAREEAERNSRASKKRMKWVWTFVILGAIVYGIVKLNDGPAPVDPLGNFIVGTMPSDDDWSKGNPDAPNVLVEYSDFQCPACAAYHAPVKRLIENIGDDVRLVYRHFPLRQAHPNAQLAGQAAEAAGMQGKFFEMHDILFARQSDWSNGNPEEKFVTYAGELELDVDKFKKDMKSGEAKKAVNEDYSSGLKANVQSTPSFFLNGQLIKPQPDYETFRAIIRAATPEPESAPEETATSTPEA